MFVKASGPVVFSDSSDSDENEYVVEDHTNQMLTEDVIKCSKDSDSDTNDENCDKYDEQPNKKKKIF